MTEYRLSPRESSGPSQALLIITNPFGAFS